MLGEKIDLLDYLKSLPEVPDPFKPFENDTPIRVIEKTEAEKMLEHIRQMSLGSLLCDEKKLSSLYPHYTVLLEQLADSSKDTEIKMIRGERDNYYYSGRYMTDNFAFIAMLIEDGD